MTINVSKESIEKELQEIVEQIKMEREFGMESKDSERQLFSSIRLIERITGIKYTVKNFEITELN